jgi:hypothetical protein
MLKAILVAVLGALIPAAAPAQSGAPVPDAEIQAACDRALAERGVRTPSRQLRDRCLKMARARIARGQIQPRTCWYAVDPNQVGWSMDSADFARIGNIPMCPGGVRPR